MCTVHVITCSVYYTYDERILLLEVELCVVCLCSNDAYLLEKNKPAPVPTSIIHAPLPRQQFGVDLELLVSLNRIFYWQCYVINAKM